MTAWFHIFFDISSTIKSGIEPLILILYFGSLWLGVLHKYRNIFILVDKFLFLIYLLNNVLLTKNQAYFYKNIAEHFCSWQLSLVELVAVPTFKPDLLQIWWLRNQHSWECLMPQLRKLPFASPLQLKGSLSSMTAGRFFKHFSIASITFSILKKAMHI